MDRQLSNIIYENIETPMYSNNFFLYFFKKILIEILNYSSKTIKGKIKNKNGPL